MKKALSALLIVILVVAALSFTGLINWEKLFPQKGPAATEEPADEFSYVVTEKARYRMKAEGNTLHYYDKGQWSSMFIKGINIGATKPGIFPGELTVSYEEYYRWFSLISDMNVNTIRIYTVMRPQFYNALLDFNRQAENPIYLFQGIWLNEEDILSLADAYAENGKILNQFVSDSLEAVDVIHGKAVLPLRAGYAAGAYSADVSKYLAGWILGIEWDPNFVQTTNDSNPEKSGYDGEYLYTLSATPFEAFLARVGDSVIKYQTGEYGYQVPLSFSNWVTTDPLSHPNEPHPDEDKVSVNVENIRSRNTFYPRMFATYHVYPYYPDSLNYQTDYIDYIDPYGKKNPYRAYLRDIKLAHSMPVLVGEFGIPTARGMGHASLMGYNQGGVDETDQGAMLLDMVNSIYEENLAGGLIFTWQDEWFKRTWNNEHFDVADSRPFWSNIQTNEQAFGILAFDPGKTAPASLPDGNFSEWTEEPVLIGNAGSLYVKSDERYLYLHLKTENFNFDTDTLYIPIETLAGQGNFSYAEKGLTFDKAADFVVQINGKDNTRILVDSYYDSFYYLYGEQYKMLPEINDIKTRNSGRFFPMRMCYGFEMTIPPENTVVPFLSFETGKLTYGNANPSAAEYRSLADFCYAEGGIELRIPWQLLNVMDPSSREIMNDFYTMQYFTPVKAESFYFGLGKEGEIALAGEYALKEWTVPQFHERLKPAYYALQEGLKKYQ